MTTNDELTRLREAFAAPAGKAAPEPEACPPSDRIWLAVRGELPSDELREIVDHVAACPACAEDWRIAMVFEEEARAAAPAAPLPATRPTARPRIWMAVAASILVAFVGFQLYRPPTPEYRGGEETGIHSLVEGQSLSRDAFILRWDAYPGAEAYELDVTRATLDPLFHAEVTEPTCQVPANVLKDLRSGDKVLWKVTPVTRDGLPSQLPTFTNLLQ